MEGEQDGPGSSSPIPQSRQSVMSKLTMLAMMLNEKDNPPPNITQEPEETIPRSLNHALP